MLRKSKLSLGAAWVSKHCDKVSTPEYIGCKKRTQGTETSKYLEEQRKKLIPSVAASERGGAQTGLRSGVEGALS